MLLDYYYHFIRYVNSGNVLGEYGCARTQVCLVYLTLYLRAYYAPPQLEPPPMPVLPRLEL
jgi:hypothetical protein